MQLGQAEHRCREQIRLVVVEPVPRRIQRGVLQPERRREVDQAADLAVQLRRQRHRRLVWETEEDDIEALGFGRVELVEDQVRVMGRQARVQRTGQRACLAVAGRIHHVEVRVLRAQSQQLGARVPGCTDDSDSSSRRMIIHDAHDHAR